MTDPNLPDRDPATGQFTRHITRIHAWVRSVRPAVWLGIFLAILTLSVVYLYMQEHHNSKSFWELNRVVYKILTPRVDDHETRIKTVERAITDPTDGILLQLRELHDRSHSHESNAGVVPAPAAPKKDPPTSQATQQVKAKSSAAKAGTATSNTQQAARATGQASTQPQNEDELLGQVRARHDRMSRTLTAARAAHEAHRVADEQVEVLVDEVAGDEQSLSANDAAALADHRQRYRPAPTRVGNVSNYYGQSEILYMDP